MLRKFSSGRPTETATESVIPFDLVGHTIRVKARINGSTSEYDFILDTGAITMMDERVAQELKIERGAEMPTPDESKKAYLTDEPVAVTLGDAGVEDFIIPIFDLGSVFDSDLEVDGFIGSDFLRFFRTTIDYQRQVIVLALEQSASEIPDGAYSMKISKPFPMRFPTVECKIDGSRKKPAMIDTGCRRALVIPLSELDEWTGRESGTLIQSRGDIARWPFTQGEQSYLGRVRSLEIGSLTVANMPTVFAELPSDGEHLLLGKEFLSEFLVTIDYPEDRLILVPIGKVDMKDNVFSTGMRIVKTADGRVSVVGFWEGSPAEMAGIELGDELLTLNSQRTDQMTLAEMVEVLRDETVEIVDLLVRRDDQELEFSLEKKTLLPPVDER
jgi:hypothetical protein